VIFEPKNGTIFYFNMATGFRNLNTQQRAKNNFFWEFPKFGFFGRILSAIISACGWSKDLNKKPF
jgi:hypothetical protein